MRWYFDGSGEWTAKSAMPSTFKLACMSLIQSGGMIDNGEGFCPLEWKIVVCDDGTFDVSESDKELRGRKSPCFPTLDAAKSWCEDREEILIEDRKSLATGTKGQHGREDA